MLLQKWRFFFFFNYSFLGHLFPLLAREARSRRTGASSMEASIATQIVRAKTVAFHCCRCCFALEAESTGRNRFEFDDGLNRYRYIYFLFLWFKSIKIFICPKKFIYEVRFIRFTPPKKEKKLDSSVGLALFKTRSSNKSEWGIWFSFIHQRSDGSHWVKSFYGMGRKAESKYDSIIFELIFILFNNSFLYCLNTKFCVIKNQKKKILIY